VKICDGELHIIHHLCVNIHAPIGKYANGLIQSLEKHFLIFFVMYTIESWCYKVKCPIFIFFHLEEGYFILLNICSFGTRSKTSILFWIVKTSPPLPINYLQMKICCEYCCGFLFFETPSIILCFK